MTASTFEWARNNILVFPLNHNNNPSEIGTDEMTATNERDDDHRHTPDVV
jgi:hypothetical protein